MTRRYYRPIFNADAAPGEGAVRCGALWYDHVEVLERGVAPRCMPVAAVARDALAGLGGFNAPRAQIMGVLNVTPDSFSDGGRFHDVPSTVAHARGMVAAGADILDIGGESTRPGAALVSVEDEIARTVPVIAAIRAAGIDTPISIDTRKAAVAKAALEAGASMLNDVSALTFDPEMAHVAACADVPICLMHAQGDPATMQKDPTYADVVLDVYDHLAAQIAQAEAAGIAREKIIVDPGIGFGKTQEHNLALLRRLSLFHGLGCPILLGVSRKRFIGTITGVAQADQRMVGSVVVATEALRQGVQIIRAHDIGEHRQAFTMWNALNPG